LEKSEDKVIGTRKFTNGYITFMREIYAIIELA
jgi:hypothetical protein